MDLFHIDRYEENESMDKNALAEQQLLKLKEKMKKRKSAIMSLTENDEISEVPLKKKKSKKKNKEEHDIEIQVIKDKESDNEEKVAEKKKKKKKRKESKEIILDENNGEEVSLVSPVESNDIISITNNNNDEQNDSNFNKDLGELNNTTNTTNIEETPFQILQQHKKIQKVEVKRTLPKWITNQKPISPEIQNEKISLSKVDFLNEELQKLLAKNNVEYLFPVQSAVAPCIINENKILSRKQYQPCDICVQSPTGSGKTLSYVLPIIEILSKKIIHQLSCIVVLPSTDLAVQVKHVFDQYIQGFNLKVALLSGLHTFTKEQNKLVEKSLLGNVSIKVDIIVCTPGRLVDHIKMTKGFSLEHLQFLVIDEADKLLSQDYSGWLSLIMSNVYASKNNVGSEGLRSSFYPINASKFQQNQLPLQKLLFSATLTQNPEKLSQLSLFKPILFVTQTSNKTEINDSTETTVATNSTEENNTEQERFVLPENLQQKMIVVSSVSDKPLVLLHVLLSMNYKRILCFTKSVEATNRLYLLLQSYGGLKVSEFSSNLTEVQRKGIIRDFKEDKIDVVISSDVMARGMHIDNVQLVVNYDTAVNDKSYVHRVGRTARAGEQGLAITILAAKEVYHFKQMCKRLSSKCIRLKILHDELSVYIEKYEAALKQLQIKIADKKRSKTLK